MRLCDRGLLEATWEADPPVGRPPQAHVWHHRCRRARGRRGPGRRKRAGGASASQPPASAHARNRAMSDPGPAGNRFSRALAIVVRLLPSHRSDWGRAMQAELAALDDVRVRRRYALGCARAVLRDRTAMRTVAAHVAGRDVRCRRGLVRDLDQGRWCADPDDRVRRGSGSPRVVWRSTRTAGANRRGWARSSAFAAEATRSSGPTLCPRSRPSCSCRHNTIAVASGRPTWP